MKRTAILLVLSSIFLCDNACGHGFVIYVSTPFSPPEGFLWVLFIYLALFVFGNLAIWRKHKIGGWFQAICDPIFSLIILAAILFVYGFLGMQNFPCFWILNPVYWGWRWNLGAILIFSIGNIVCFVGLMLILYRGGKLRRHKSNGNLKRVLKYNLLIYLVCLIPYIVTGAYAHGWGGIYASMKCDSRIRRIHTAILEYAKEHDMKMPVAESIDDLIAEIEPYLYKDRDIKRKIEIICPVSAAFERKAQSFKWNKEMSGKPIKNLLDGSDEIGPIFCPYHEGSGFFYEFYLSDVEQAQWKYDKDHLNDSTEPDDLSNKVESN